MNNEAEKQASPNETPKWLEATAEDFQAVDINKPVVEVSSVDTRQLWSAYTEYCKISANEQCEAETRVYAMLAAVCSFHFRPSNYEEPFEPMMRLGDRRSPAPTDFKGEPAKLLAGNINRISNPAVRARVADTVWLLDRKQAAAAIAALDAYIEVINAVRRGSHSFLSGAGVHSADTTNHLRRGIYIARSIGWEKEQSLCIRALVSELRAEAAKIQNHRSFQRFAALDLDFRISDPSVIAAEAEELVEKEDDYYSQHSLYHIAARAHRLAKNEADCNRNLLSAAECLVKIADNHGGSALFESHWLECAIKEMHRIPNTRERRRQLKHRLVDAQAEIYDELSSFSHTQDISDIVEDSRAAVRNKPLMAALYSFSRLSQAPSPKQLEEEARKIIAEHPLSSIFATTQYDSTGKPVYRDKGIEDDDDGAVVQRHIAQSENFRRSLVVDGCIEPARLAIIDEHHVDEDAIGIICVHSPFVPQERISIYTNGFHSFFHGDIISAIHTLVPQLENSLRHVLRLRGHDVTKLNDDMTQEDLGLSVLLAKLRTELDAIFGDRMITDIDNVFNNRAGPNLRNRLAHGLLSDGEARSRDAIYGCWLIFQLCCIPLYPYWDRISSAYEL